MFARPGPISGSPLVLRSNSRIRSRSAVTPGRWPASVSARRTHLRSVSAGATRLLRDRTDRRPLRVVAAGCSRTIRTARSRTSGLYLLGRPMTKILVQSGLRDSRRVRQSPHQRPRHGTARRIPANQRRRHERRRTPRRPAPRTRRPRRYRHRRYHRTINDTGLTRQDPGQRSHRQRRCTRPGSRSLHRIESTDVARVRRQRCVTKPSRHAANAAHGRPRKLEEGEQVIRPEGAVP